MAKKDPRDKAYYKRLSESLLEENKKLNKELDKFRAVARVFKEWTQDECEDWI